MTDHTTELLLQTRSRYYEHGDKASKLLAHQLRQASSSHQIQTDSGVTTEPLEINKEFKELYMSLYSSDHGPTSPNFDNFFDELVILPIEQSVAKEL